MEFIWNIKTLNVLPTLGQYKDVVYSVMWTVIGKDGDHSASTEGAVVTNTENISLFTEYENLTKDQVLNWVIESLGAEGKAKAEAQVTKSIEDQKTAITVVASQKLPWLV